VKTPKPDYRKNIVRAAKQTLMAVESSRLTIIRFIFQMKKIIGFMYQKTAALNPLLSLRREIFAMLIVLLIHYSQHYIVFVRKLLKINDR
jgi:hypothetical protein